MRVGTRKPGIQAGTILKHTYTRDGMGNVSTLDRLILPEPAPGITDYTHTANRLVSSTGVEAAAYTYDNARNIIYIDGPRYTLHYSQNNRLVKITYGRMVVAEYAYDGFERRVKKVAGGVTTHYHYDLNGRLIAETDGAGNPIRDYVYLDGEPVAMQVYGAGWYWFLNDHLGTPQKLMDHAGEVVWQAAYMPFGEARVLTADVENNLRFPGQYFDFETGLHYNWHRYYDPETGRYLRPDPIGLGGGINIFSYADLNPINATDPNGLLVDGGIISGPAAYFVAGAIAGGILYYGAPIAADVGQWLGGVLWNENTEDDSCPIPGTTKGRKTKGKTDQREKEGDFDTANEDFDSLSPESVKNLPNGGRTGILPDGRKINVRPHSTDGRPTIEIQKGKKKIKIRYGN